MSWQEIERRLLDSLYRELRSNWGRISEIEERLGVSKGYLAKLCQSRDCFKLSLFLKTIDALGRDQRSFFSRALSIRREPEDYLRQLEDAKDVDRAFSRIGHATRELETSEPLEAHRSAVATAADVEEFAACPQRSWSPPAS